MKAVVAAFNQEKALVGAFSVIVQFHRLIDLRHYVIGQVLILHIIAADDMLMRQNKSSVELIDLSSNTCFHKVFARNIVLTESAKMDTANIDN